MRSIGSLHPSEGIALPPDVMGVAVITTALAVVAADWPGSSLGSTSLRPDIVILASPVGFYFNDGSTGAAVPSTNSSGTTGASRQQYIPPNVRVPLQIPGGSTGYSLTGATSGVVSIEFFKKGAGA